MAHLTFGAVVVTRYCVVKEAAQWTFVNAMIVDRSIAMIVNQ